MLKRRQSSLQAKAGEVHFHRCLERKMAGRIPVQRYAGHITGFSRVTGAPNEQASTR